MKSITSCFCLSKANMLQGSITTQFLLLRRLVINMNEVEALQSLFEQLSSSIIDDGRIHRKNGVIEFGEFVRTLNIFHPDTPQQDKIAFAFNLYDLRHTGYIEREELKDMVLATLRESELSLSEDDVEAIVDKTLQEADLNGDGKIDLEEWKKLVAKYPSLTKNMTLPHLREITLAFPNFVMETEVVDSELVC
ncbi:hypothetical protein SASPL_151179 [Salvia splendens]|uniref:Calcineurin B-like protein n=1 Tax=Salvia splendens TaxID=180675 RepID=A0A8X8W854_SALSN|nr:hypothetical protein SASPL_151179 [Salvia splendens]